MAMAPGDSKPILATKVQMDTAQLLAVARPLARNDGDRGGTPDWRAGARCDTAAPPPSRIGSGVRRGWSNAGSIADASVGKCGPLDGSPLKSKTARRARKRKPRRGAGAQDSTRRSSGSLLLLRRQATLDLLPSAVRSAVDGNFAIGIHLDHPHVPHLPHCPVTEDGLEENVSNILVCLCHP